MHKRDLIVGMALGAGMVYYLDPREGASRRARLSDRLRDLLSGRTGKLSEVIEVEQELARVVEEVERLEGALAGYDRRIAWSTVRLELHQVAPIVQAGFRAQVVRAFRGGIASFTAVSTGLVYAGAFLSPWILLGSLLLWGFLRVRARRTRGESMA